MKQGGIASVSYTHLKRKPAGGHKELLLILALK